VDHLGLEATSTSPDTPFTRPTIDRARGHVTGWVHLLGDITALGAVLVNWLLRSTASGNSLRPWGLALSLLTAVLLGVTGWTGGELTYPASNWRDRASKSSGGQRLAAQRHSFENTSSIDIKCDQGVVAGRCP
jgi:hypothetical protein